MASPAQCIANAQNATFSTGPKSAEGKAAVARNGVRHGLFATYEQLAPDQREHINRCVEELHAGFPRQCAAFEDVISELAIATWRRELCRQLEASFFSNAVASEMENPESAALVEKFGEDILLGRAMTRDAEGPNVFTKLMRYQSRVAKDLDRAREAYARVIEVIHNRIRKAKPISGPKAATPLPETCVSPAEAPRNAPCPCGSGQKYKRCCGAAAPEVVRRTPAVAACAT
jgi:SEC-C motif-containing protein